MRAVHVLAFAGAAVVSISPLAACGGEEDDKGESAGGKVAIDASDDGCEVAKKEFRAGRVEFKITNKGTKVTEVYVYASGDKVVTERENIGPGTGVDFTVELSAGKYQIACKPGMVGKGIRQDITVT